MALEARDINCGNHTTCSDDGIASRSIYTQNPILVALSIGSYGVYVDDGSEYSGDYDSAIIVSTLIDFHRSKIQVLAESGADLLAF